MTSKKQERWRRLLRKAANVYKKFGWCKGYFAKDATGNDAEVIDPNACSFCIHGALKKAALVEFKDGYAAYKKEYATAFQMLNTRLGGAWKFNDNMLSSKEEAREAILRVADSPV